MAINQLQTVTSFSEADKIPVFSDDLGADAKGTLGNLAEFLRTLQSSAGMLTQYASPIATDFSVTIAPPADGVSMFLLLTPTAGFAVGSITLPPQAECADGQEVLIASTQAVNTLTVNGNGATVNMAAGGLAANGSIRLRFDAVQRAWYSVGGSSGVGGGGGGGTPDPDTVTNDMLYPMQPTTIKANVGGSVANPIDATPAQIKGILGYTIADIADAASATTLAAHTANTSNPHSVTKAQVGLGNADNTSDLNKPVSTATQAALDLKAPLASPALTGTPTAPTPGAGDSSTKLSTTAFVAGELANRVKRASGVPTGGADGDVQIRTDSPFAGVPYLKTAGVWAPMANEYTWAGRPAASGNTGLVITITDAGQRPMDYVSDGTDWRPVASFQRYGFQGTVAAPVQTITGVTGAGSLFTNATMTLHAASLYIGKRFRLTYWIHRSGTATGGTISHVVKVGSANTYAGDISISTLSLALTDGLDTPRRIEFVVTTGTVIMGQNGLSEGGSAANQFANAMTGALNLANAHYVNIGVQALSAADSVSLIGAWLEELN